MLVCTAILLNNTIQGTTRNDHDLPETTRNHQEQPRTLTFSVFHGFSKIYRYHVHLGRKVLVCTAIPLNNTIRRTTRNHQNPPRTTKNLKEPAFFYGFSKFHRSQMHLGGKVLVYTAIPLNSTIRRTTRNHQKLPGTTRNNKEPSIS